MKIQMFPLPQERHYYGTRILGRNVLAGIFLLIYWFWYSYYFREMPIGPSGFSRIFDVLFITIWITLLVTVGRISEYMLRVKVPLGTPLLCKYLRCFIAYSMLPIIIIDSVQAVYRGGDLFGICKVGIFATTSFVALWYIFAGVTLLHLKTEETKRKAYLRIYGK